MGTEPGPQLEPTLLDSISRSPVLDSLLPHQEPHSGPASSHRPLSFISGPGSQPFQVPSGVPSLISPRPCPVPPSSQDLVPSVQRSPLPKVAAISIPSQLWVARPSSQNLLGNGGRIHKCSERSPSLSQGHSHPWVFTMCIIAMLSLIEADVYIRSRKFTWLLLGVLRIFQEICSFVLCSPYPSSVLGIFCFLSFLSLCGLGLASSHMPRSRLPGLAIYFKGETFHFMH